ncbi:MAG: 23S rRNA pseudouridine(1911/1915/1917) synthase RluD [gamma proteobacterium symbiont of Bathyaustriella thionipta]|nr:23S rRNA pseudouridine(1911/1915/1917) synthase RluD [gamma proteobacterium symbiont of Bathyaustriella thionipta]
MAGMRLDQAAASLYPQYSRSRLQSLIDSGALLLDGQRCRQREKLKGGEQLLLSIPDTPVIEDRPEPISLNIVYQDETLLVINKPAGMVVHPAVGNPGGTLVNGLLHFDPALAQLPRAGLVHRLDKETSGLLVIARTPEAHQALVDQLQRREFEREYRALINGCIIAGGKVDEPIGRHPTQRQRMAVHPNGKAAVTHYRLLRNYRAHALLKLKLETGRTHQIRVHMAFIRHPISGDPLYGGRVKLPPHADELLINRLRQFKRQALHAFHLGLQHPEHDEWMSWECPIPDDMQELINLLSADADHNRD